MARSSRSPLKDWHSLETATTSYTAEQLQQYNAVGADPYLVQIAQLIGSQFNIALQSQRNLANVFSNLPQDEFYRGRMGLGFSDRHPARLLSESDGGFAFLSILGCLGEYFAEDVVVAVIMKLVRDFQSGAIPEAYQPDDFQWKRLVHLCQGVLATSSFGTTVTRIHESPRILIEYVSVSQIADGLIDMSNIACGGKEKASLERVGADAFWFAATAEYLFDLKVVVQDLSGGIVTFQPGVDSTNAQLIVGQAQPVFDEDSPDRLPLSKAYLEINHSKGQFNSPPLKMGDVPDPLNVAGPVSGGRVPWEKLFRSCFGRTYTDIEPSLVAGFTGSAASLLSSSLEYGQTKSQEVFLPHASTIRGLSGYGLVETVTSWFPELRRLAPQMGKAARLPFQEARDKADEISAILESSCMCSSCGNAPGTSTEFCKHSLVEVILELGLYIARAVVIPNLFPKRSGIIAFYHRLHAARLLYRARQSPATEAFKKGFVAALPTPRHMIETMSMLFAGSVPANLTDHTVGISYEGLFISLNAWTSNSGVRDPENEHVMIRQRAGVNISSGSSHLHGRSFTHGYWVPSLQGKGSDAESAPLSFSESFELMRTKPKELKQIVKPRMGDLMFSFIGADKGEEERAEKMGWLVL